MKKTSIFTKLAFIIVIAFLAVQIVNVSARLDRAARARAALKTEINSLEVSNADFSYKIEHKDDEQVIEDIARELGLIRQGEQVFYD